MSQFKFYVYEYQRLDGTPYYIGRGCGYRATTKGKGEIGKPTDKTRIRKIAINLSYVESIILEKKLIKLYGRKDNLTGILRNKTEGGEGNVGLTPWNKGINTGPQSDAWKEKRSVSISNAVKGIPKPKLVSRLINRKEMSMANFANWQKHQGKLYGIS